MAQTYVPTRKEMNEGMMPKNTPPTRKFMNQGIMPEGVPPTLQQMKMGARLSHKPFALAEKYLMKRHGVRDLKEAKRLEKAKKEKKISGFL